MSDEDNKKSAEFNVKFLSMPTMALLILACTFGFDMCGSSHELKCSTACGGQIHSVSPVHCACK